MLFFWLTGYITEPAERRDLPAVQSSVDWCAHYADNAKDPYDIPWQEGVRVTKSELAEIAPSLCAWQLGETSDGAHLRRAAENYAKSAQDPQFVAAVDLFIQEEQRHGEMLGQFLDAAGVPRVQSNWGDTTFRSLRYLFANMEVWATPVVMVETHALIFFNAIRQATDCPVLRRICAQILSDETRHVRFQCERLAILHRHRPSWLRALTMMLHRVLFIAVTLAIWIGHRRALKAGGYHFGRFWRSAWAKMRHAWQLMDADGYRW